MNDNEHKGGAAKAVGPVILSGLLAQVGAVCPALEPGRDSSREVTVGRRDAWAWTHPAATAQPNLSRPAWFAHPLLPLAGTMQGVPVAAGR